jgi:4-hydroxybenzoate polyprenyltransferase
MYKTIQILSLDVAAGACLMTHWVATVGGVALPWSIYFALFCATWLVYTVDHLMDAVVIDAQKEVSVRHLFHKKHQQSLWLLWVMVLVSSSFVSVLYLPESTIRWGLWVVMMAIAHMVLVKLFGNKNSVFIQKELGVALGYTLGVCIGPFSMLPHDTFFSLSLITGFIFCVSLANVLLFSLYDHKIDREQKLTSIIQNIGKKGTVIILYALLGIACCIALVFFFKGNELSGGIALSMTGSLVFLLLFPSWFEHERYRILGDSIFLYPVILLLL